mmetsp:Transcript_18849/g.28897  ORF Transcript_18849/g.28897 Transcript_18849/m.28897 type:complete len:152 (+) Transcript_18849:10-465(+)
MAEVRNRKRSLAVPVRPTDDAQRKALLPSAASRRGDPVQPTPSREDAAASLLRAHALLSDQVSHANEIRTNIADDGKSLRKTKDDGFGTLGDAIGSAGSAFRRLRMQQEWDDVVLKCSLAFFMCCVIYVLWTRIPIFMVFRPVVAMIERIL